MKTRENFDEKPEKIETRENVDENPEKIGTRDIIGSMRNSDHDLASGEYFQTPAPQNMIYAVMGRISDFGHCMTSGQLCQTSASQDKKLDTVMENITSQNRDHSGQTTAWIYTNVGIVIETSSRRIGNQWLNYGQITAIICTKSNLQRWSLQWLKCYSNSGTTIKTWTMQYTNFRKSGKLHMQLWALVWLNYISNKGITSLAPMEVWQGTSQEATWSNHRLKIQGAAKLTISWARLSLSLELNPRSQEATWSKYRLKIQSAAKLITSWARLRSGNQVIRLSLELHFRIQMDKRIGWKEGCTVIDLHHLR